MTEARARKILYAVSELAGRTGGVDFVDSPGWTGFAVLEPYGYCSRLIGSSAPPGRGGRYRRVLESLVSEKSMTGRAAMTSLAEYFDALPDFSSAEDLELRLAASGRL